MRGCIPMSGGVLGRSSRTMAGYVILFNCRRPSFDVPGRWEGKRRRAWVEVWEDSVEGQEKKRVEGGEGMVEKEQTFILLV